MLTNAYSDLVFLNPRINKSSKLSKNNSKVNSEKQFRTLRFNRDLQRIQIKMSKAEENPTLTELDCSNAGRGVWLVKVPKYVAKKWLKGKNFPASRNFSFLLLFCNFSV